MTTLLEVLQEVDTRRIAVGHFNVSDLVTLYGVIGAARQHGLPVVVGVSEAERRFIGVQRLVAIVHAACAGSRGREAGRGSAIGAVQRRFAVRGGVDEYSREPLKMMGSNSLLVVSGFCNCIEEGRRSANHYDKVELTIDGFPCRTYVAAPNPPSQASSIPASFCTRRYFS